MAQAQSLFALLNFINVLMKATWNAYQQNLDMTSCLSPMPYFSVSYMTSQPRTGSDTCGDLLSISK